MGGLTGGVFSTVARSNQLSHDFIITKNPLSASTTRDDFVQRQLGFSPKMWNFLSGTISNRSVVSLRSMVRIRPVTWLATLIS